MSKYSLFDLLKEDISSKYNLAGNCVTGLDDPYFQRNVCYDATEMAGIVDEDSNEFLTSEEFLKKVNWPSNQLGPAEDTIYDFAYNEYKDIYWAYNIEDDVHFFFIKDRINENYKDYIKVIKLSELLKEELADAYTIYLDMDGVLTDFERRFEQFAGVTPDEYTAQKSIEFGKAKADEEFWNLIDKQIGVRFWAGMPWMPQGEELYNYVKKYKPQILTSPSRDESSRIGKGVWVKRNMPNVPLKFGYKAEGKAKFAGPNKILIDDRVENINAWKAAGGIGILFKSTEQVKNELSKLGL